MYQGMKLIEIFADRILEIELFEMATKRKYAIAEIRVLKPKITEHFINSLIFNSAGVYGIPRTKSWYTNPFIRQGYSNESQVMGASIGPGSNSETFGIAWIKGMKRIGIQGERIAHNNDFYYYNYLSYHVDANGNGYFAGTSNKYWADMSLAFHVQYDYKQLLFSGFVNFTNSLNYHWVKLDGIGYADPSPLSDRKNTQASFTISYFFKRNAASLLHLPD